MCWGKRGLGFSKASLPFIYSTNTPKQSCFVFGFQNFQLRAHPFFTAIHCLGFCCRVQCWECISAGMAKPLCCSPPADLSHGQTGQMRNARVLKGKLR